MTGGHEADICTGKKQYKADVCINEAHANLE